MDDLQRPPINLSNDDTQHVYMLTDPKKKGIGLRIFIILFLAFFLGVIISVVVTSLTDVIEGYILFPIVTVVLVALFSVISAASRKKEFTHLVLTEKGITFLRRNNETVYYTLAQFVNLKVTRHYYNGAYTGSSHSLLFKNEKNKQIEIGLGGMDKDLISSMFDDIQNMKYNGKFFTPGIQPALRTVPVEGAAQATDISGEAPVKTEIDPQFPFGVSAIDGKYYTHDADKVVDYNKSQNKSYILLVITFALGALAFGILTVVFTSKSNTPAIPFAIAIACGFAFFICGAVFLGLGIQNKETSGNLIKKIEFYSNCIVLTSTYEKKIFNIPDMMRVFILNPTGKSPKSTRSLKIQTKDSAKFTFNMGKIASKKNFEIFGNYNQFYADMQTWCANHGIACVNDISI